jgi:hypothetical protein
MLYEPEAHQDQGHSRKIKLTVAWPRDLHYLGAKRPSLVEFQKVIVKGKSAVLKAIGELDGIKREGTINLILRRREMERGSQSWYA